MDRYIGLDAHTTSCTLAVMGPTGRRLKELVVDTDERVLRDTLRGIAGDRRLCMEEGFLSEWLYEVVEPHVREVVVVRPGKIDGPKNDAADAWRRADELRRGTLSTVVYKQGRTFATLRQATRTYELAVREMVRCKNRLRMHFRARGITPDRTLYEALPRARWIAMLPVSHRRFAEFEGERLDTAIKIRDDAEAFVLEAARGNAAVKRISTVPGVATVRASMIVATIGSPYRFRTKRQLWSYSGLAVVTHSSADWMKDKSGKWRRRRTSHTRGLAHGNKRLKSAFVEAARVVVHRIDGHPLKLHYERLVESGTKPSLALLTIARRIAAAILAMWKKQEDYDPEKQSSET